MKKLLPIAIILMLLLTACGDFAPEATVEPTVAAEYTYTGETYPRIYAGAAAGELARAVTAIMLGLDREGAAELVSQSTSAAAWEALASAGGGLALAADTWDLPEGVDVAAVATDALVFYVSPDNPVDSLTLDELEEIFTGAETNWSAFGGPDAEIVIMGREPGSGSVEALKSLIGGDEGLVTDVRGQEASEGVIGFGFYCPCVKQGLAGGCKLLAVDGVRKTSMYEITSVSIEEETISAYVSDDFGELEMMKPYEGEFPVYDNEIGLTGVLAKRLGKKIGDTLKVEYQGVEAEYVISGLGQTMSNFGRQCFLNTDGLRRVNPSYERNSILVYLEDGYDATEMIDVLENRFDVLSPSGSREKDEKADAKRKAEEKLANLISMYGVDSVQFALMRDGEIVLSGDTSSYQIDRIENTEKMFVSNINSVAAAVGMVSVIILLGTMLIITLVFYIVIKSMIIRRKHEFGIFKAVGYTDRQLMQQVAASFLPVSVLGAAAGCVVSTMAINPIASRLFEQVGISRMDFVINPLVLAAMSVALVLFAFLISMGVAGKIKGISVYSLLTED